MTKAELMDKLDELGIEYTGEETKSELEALLPVDEPEVEEPEVPEVHVGREAHSVRVVNGAGLFIREYSERVHGKDYKKMAMDFCDAPKNKRHQYKMV